MTSRFHWPDFSVSHKFAHSALLCLFVYLSLYLPLSVSLLHVSSGAGNYYQTLQYSLILFIFLLFSSYLTPIPTVNHSSLFNLCISLFLMCSYKMLILFFLYVKITYEHYILLYTSFFILHINLCFK